MLLLLLLLFVSFSNIYYMYFFIVMKIMNKNFHNYTLICRIHHINNITTIWQFVHIMLVLIDVTIFISVPQK